MVSQNVLVKVNEKFTNYYMKISYTVNAYLVALKLPEWEVATSGEVSSVKLLLMKRLKTFDLFGM